MNRWLSILCVGVVAGALSACTADVDDLTGSDPGDSAFALTNTTHYNPEGLLRGQGLKIYTELSAEGLDPDRNYDVDVTNDNTDEVLSEGEVYVTEDNTILDYALMFDVGQYGEVEEGDNLRVTLSNEEGTSVSQVISLAALRLPGWDVTEVEAPEVFVSDQSGNPANAYAVLGQDPGEVAGEVHLTGSGFHEGIRNSEVDVYIVAARDNWMNELIPQEGEEDHIFGPVAMMIDGQGNLPVTSTGFTPGEANIGPFDVLVDTDGNGRMDWSLAVKDSGDGVDEQVGFTVQYSQAWVRARGERHVLVNIAYNSNSRDGGAWTNTFYAGNDIFSYLNPPVMHQYHFAVTKWFVSHQDFEEFWNNRSLETTDDSGNACVPFEDVAVQRMGIPVQRGCTNTGPVHFGPAAILLDPTTGDETDSFDVVFDRNGDGCYAPGVDLLDVIGGDNATGGLVSFSDFNNLAETEQVGFRVVE